MSDDDSLPDILQKLEAGDEQAAAEIFQRYSTRLIRLARSRISPKLRQKFDPEDVVQSVFRSFFVRQSQGDFEFANWDGLWGLLVRMTLNKCGRRIEGLHAACRDCRREVNTATQDTAKISDPWDIVVREPQPDEVVSLAEMLENLMSGLDETERAILSMRLQEFTVEEIASAVGNISERKVYRVLAAVRKKLERTQER